MLYLKQFTTDSIICILDFTAICGRQPGPVGLFLYQRKATVQDRMCKIGSPFLVAKLFSRAHLQSLPLNKCISRQVCRHTANIYIVKNTTLYCVLTSKTFLAFSHRCTACGMNVQVYNGFTALTLYFDLSYLQCMQSEYVS